MADLLHPKILLVDTRFLFDQYSHRGIGRYGKEMVGKLLQKLYRKQLNEWQVHLVGFKQIEDNLPLLNTGLEAESLLKLQQMLTFYSLGKPNLSSPIRNLISYHTQVKKLIERVKPNAYWAVHFDRILPTELTSVVATVHDAIPLVTGKYSTKGTALNWLKGLYYKYTWQKVKQANLVLTSSEFSKRDLVNYGSLDPAKISVAYLGVSEVFERKNVPLNTKLQVELLSRYDIRTTIRAGNAQVSPYLIYDGGLEQNKNWPQLLQIFAKLCSHLPELRLVITGGDFSYDPLQKVSTPANTRAQALLDLADELNVTQRLVPTGKLTDIEMSILLSQALGYINLSSYEGFGLGPVQAMAAQVPATVSHHSCFPEIVGDSALLVDPEDILRSTASILELLTSKGAIDELTSKGSKQVKNYSWDNCFATTWNAIQSKLD